MEEEQPEDYDTRIVWMPGDREQVAAAYRAYRRYAEKGYMIYGINRDGKKVLIMRHFDHTAGRMLVSPPVRMPAPGPFRHAPYPTGPYISSLSLNIDGDIATLRRDPRTVRR